MANKGIEDFTISSGKVPRTNPSPAGEGLPTPKDQSEERNPEFQYPPDGKPGDCEEA